MRGTRGSRALLACVVVALACAGCGREPRRSEPAGAGHASEPRADTYAQTRPSNRFHASWPQFGGPNHDFKVDDPGVAENWPKEGPPVLWSRPLGPGYSSIVGAGERLYTMYRDGGREVVVRLDAATGETIWEHAYDAPTAPGHDHDYGDGPNATPLLTGGRLYTIGVAGLMHCLDAETGFVLWSHDFPAEFGGFVPELGYSSSLLEYEDTVIALVGGEGRSIVAFDKADGHVVWGNLSFEPSYSTPIVMKIHGEDQLVAFMATEVIGADQLSGELEWEYSIRNEYPQNICQPVQLGEDLVFVSTWAAGSRGLRLVPGDPIRAEELWSTRRLQCFYSSVVRVGDHIYGTSGYQAAPIMTGLHAATGQLAWRRRGFAVASLLGVGDRLIILDEEGVLTLATPGPEGLAVHSQAQVATTTTRTPPTLLGTVLYVRNQQEIMALDLGPQPPAGPVDRTRSASYSGREDPVP